MFFDLHVSLLCRQLHEKFTSVYEVTQDIGRLAIPSEMQSTVSEWMENVPTALEGVANQVNSDLQK